MAQPEQPEQPERGEHGSAAPRSAARVGFLGLGIMGSRMAANVARAGFPLSVWTHTPGKAARWAELHGAQALESPAEVAERSDIVLSMVVDGEQVAAIMLGEDGVIEAADAGLLCVDCSTIGPADARRVGQALRARGVAMLDAPVTGSAPRAQTGTLTIMVGGEESAFARVRALLETIGSLIVYVGELGQGQMLKLINNALGAANAAALAEALLLAASAEIDLDAFATVIGAGSGASAQLELKAGPMRAHDYTPAFKAAHMLKDVRLCMQEAGRAGIPFPAAAHALDVLTATVARGYGEQDYAAMIEAAEGFAGRRI